ncbi:MAG: peroxide stress protein YaaA [Propionibacteriaceae bacterium]
MLALLSPAKSLAQNPSLAVPEYSQPRFLADTAELVTVLRDFSPAELATLMHISEKLAHLNVNRYHDIEFPFTVDNAHQALALFQGDVYQGLRAVERFVADDYHYCQQSLRILSGFYGMLRPLDLIQPYRLEMGTQLPTERGRNLYDFWGNRLRDALISDVTQSPGEAIIVNLASVEYATAARLSDLSIPVITPRFEDQSTNGEWKIISFHAKRARGEMAGWLMKERVNTAVDLTRFDSAGYYYLAELSTPQIPVFRRPR